MIIKRIYTLVSDLCFLNRKFAENMINYHIQCITHIFDIVKVISYNSYTTKVNKKYIIIFENNEIT